MEIVNLYDVKRTLEAMRCPKCNEYPTISVAGNSLQISCCCESFKAHLNDVAKEELDTQVPKNIDSIMKNIFKKFR